MGALAAIHPTLAASFAEHLFVKAPPRRADRTHERAALDAATRSTLRFEGERLESYRFGDGPAVLLLHGWGGSAAQMTPFVARLLEAGLSAVAFDAPGHGASSGSWLTVPRYADAIERIAVASGPLHGVIAHSLGAPAASVAISRGLELSRGVFIGPPADALAWFSDFSATLGLPPRVADAARARIERRAGMSLARINAHALGPSLTCPLLVIHDRDDREVAWHDGAMVAGAARDATLVVTKGLGHRRIVSDPGVIAQAVAFVRAQEACTARDAA